LGSVATPMILPVVGAFFLAQYAAVAPNAPLSAVASFIPFVSPFVMFTRSAVSEVSPLQLGIAFLINVVAAFLCFSAAGKVYRVGLLMHGKLRRCRRSRPPCAAANCLAPGAHPARIISRIARLAHGAGRIIRSGEPATRRAKPERDFVSKLPTQHATASRSSLAARG
jgi:hypothetical protein